MNITHFLALGYDSWLECHWSLARTQEIAEKWFKNKGYVGEIYRMCFNTTQKGSDGFFAWWMPITKGDNNVQKNETKTEQT